MPKEGCRDCGVATWYGSKRYGRPLCSQCEDVYMCLDSVLWTDDKDQHACEFCDCYAQVFKDVDPFASDIHNDDTLWWICSWCSNEKADDI